MHGVSRRKLLLGLTTTTAVGLAGCSGGGSDADSSGDDESDDPSPGTVTAASTEPDSASTPNDSPDPNCARLTGSQTPYDASGTPFVFSFDYVDSWTVEDPLLGPGGRTQGLSSPVVTVDGETESAGLTVIQKFDPLTAAEVDKAVADNTSGQYNPAEVVHEQEFNGETVRVIGLADAALPYYEMWLPYGDDEARYYPVSLQLLTSIIRLDGDNVARELCLDATVDGAETVRRSLRVNPDSTIGEV